MNIFFYSSWRIVFFLIFFLFELHGSFIILSCKRNTSERKGSDYTTHTKSASQSIYPTGLGLLMIPRRVTLSELKSTLE